ncbi:MAG: hypothetical protein ACLVJ8_15585 [Ruthenibacterium lactatiformans]
MTCARLRTADRVALLADEGCAWRARRSRCMPAALDRVFGVRVARAVDGGWQYFCE